MYYVYIVANKNNQVLSIGVTGDLAGRIHDHRARLVEGFTKRYQATKVIYYEDYPDPRSAIAREKQLKGWRREKKIALIERENPRWLDLFEEIAAGFSSNVFVLEKREELIVRDPSTSSG